MEKSRPELFLESMKNVNQIYTEVIEKLKDQVKEYISKRIDLDNVKSPVSIEIDLNFKMFGCLHPDLKVQAEGDAIWFMFQGVNLGNLVYDVKNEKFHLHEDIEIKSKKGKTIYFERILTFDSLIRLIISTHLDSDKTPEEIKLTFEKMAFEGI
jgi:hypothetical protein